MKNSMIIAFCLTILLSGCKGQNQGEGAQQKISSPSSSVPRPEGEVAELFLSDMYKNIGEVFMDESIPFSQKTDFNQLYGSEDWKSTVEAVVKHDRNLDEPGFFVADPWIMGQDAVDFHATDIKAEQADTRNASVTLNLHNSGNVTRVRVLLVMEKDWKVDDLIDLTNNFDWKAAMKEYLK